LPEIASFTNCHIKNIHNKNTNKSANIDCHWLKESFRIFHFTSTLPISVISLDEFALVESCTHQISAFGVLTKNDLTKTNTINISEINPTNIVGLKIALNTLFISKY